MSIKQGRALIAGGGGSGHSEIDNHTITENSSNEIQTVAKINQNTATGAQSYLYDWCGTLQQYTDQNISTLHPEWICYITDDTATVDTVYTKTEVDGLFASLLSSLYPVDSLYIGTQSTCPLATLIPNSTWVLVAQDRSIQGSSNNHAANTTIEAGLPNITGNLGPAVYDYTLNNTSNQAFYNAGNGPSRYAPWEGQNSTKGTNYHGFDANRCSSIYGNSTTVQPPAYVVNIWRRTA